MDPIRCRIANAVCRSLMLPTPDLSHITEEEYLDVYEPAGPILLGRLLIHCRRHFYSARRLREGSSAITKSLETRLHSTGGGNRVLLGFCQHVDGRSGSGCVSAFLQKEIFLPHECCKVPFNEV